MFKNIEKTIINSHKKYKFHFKISPCDDCPKHTHTVHTHLGYAAIVTAQAQLMTECTTFNCTFFKIIKLSLKFYLNYFKYY